MKKSFLFFCLTFFVAFSANAQRVGIKAGLNIADQQFSNGNYNITSESILGFHAGLIGEVPLTRSLYFNSGIIYTEKGCSEKIETIAGNSEQTLRYGYLEIPLNLALKFDFVNVRPFVQAGPYASYVLYDKLSSDNGLFENFEFDTKKMDFGINAGAGVEFSNLQFSVNYEWGIVNLADINERYSIMDEDFSAKNGVLSVSLAILF